MKKRIIMFKEQILKLKYFSLKACLPLGGAVYEQQMHAHYKKTTLRCKKKSHQSE